MMEIFLYKNFFDLTFFRYPQLFKDVNNVWEALSQLEPFLKTLPLGKILGEVDPRAILINPESIIIGKGTIVEPGAFIRGPCVIGEECEIRHGSTIRGNVLVGDRCVIGHSTEVKNSIFLDQAQAGHLSYVGDSIVGNRVNLGAGTVCANLRLDKKPVTVSYAATRVETGLRKFGAVFGDEAQTGCNVVTNPGTILGKRARIYPCVNATGYIAENHVLKAKGKETVLA